MKVGLLYSFEESHWFSVTKIVENLKKSYVSAGLMGNIEEINYSSELDHDERKKKIVEASSKGFEKLIFLDHSPHPFEALDWFGQEALDQVKEIVFHVYGDFTLYMASWKKIEPLITGKIVKFICASNKQANLVKKFINQTELVFICPFPVDKKQFYFDSAKREEFRKENGLSDDEFIFFYAGRLSYQKNIIELVETFLNLKKENKLSPDAKLWIAGEFDAIGNPYVQGEHMLGEYFRMMENCLKSYPEEIKESVRFLGKIKNKELTKIYCGVDCFVSLSSYHDEDYGMAVAEALCCGQASVLTNWAGYSSFKSDYGIQDFVPVSLGRRRPIVDIEDASRKILKASKQKITSEVREKISEEFVAKLSIEKCGDLLMAIHNESVQSFEGMSEMSHQLGAVAKFKSHPFMNEMTKEFNQFYYKVYDVYTE